MDVTDAVVGTVIFAGFQLLSNNTQIQRTADGLFELLQVHTPQSGQQQLTQHTYNDIKKNLSSIIYTPAYTRLCKQLGQPLSQKYTIILALVTLPNADQFGEFFHHDMQQ